MPLRPDYFEACSIEPSDTLNLCWALAPGLLSASSSSAKLEGKATLRTKKLLCDENKTSGTGKSWSSSSRELALLDPQVVQPSISQTCKLLKSKVGPMHCRRLSCKNARTRQKVAIRTQFNGKQKPFVGFVVGCTVRCRVDDLDLGRYLINIFDFLALRAFRLALVESANNVSRYSQNPLSSDSPIECQRPHCVPIKKVWVSDCAPLHSLQLLPSSQHVAGDTGNRSRTGPAKLG